MIPTTHRQVWLAARPVGYPEERDFLQGKNFGKMVLRVGPGPAQARAFARSVGRP